MDRYQAATGLLPGERKWWTVIVSILGVLREFSLAATLGFFRVSFTSVCNGLVEKTSSFCSLLYCNLVTKSIR